jgi:hypothetical protein
MEKKKRIDENKKLLEQLINELNENQIDQLLLFINKEIKK